MYNSIYRADEQLLVNTHIYGMAANNAPVFHLRKMPGGDMARSYLESFEQRLGWRHAVRGRLTVARRIDYHDDPDAPKANSMVPSVNVVVANEVGEILLIRRSDNDNWALPGGAIDLGESLLRQACARPGKRPESTVRSPGSSESTPTPAHIILYTSNGEARQEFSIVLTARPVAGSPTPSDESTEVRWVPPRLRSQNYAMDRLMRLRIGHYLDRSGSPVIT